jgi:hypothetical protein
MSKPEDENKALKLLLVILISPLSSVFSGYVFSRLWLWFAVGPFQFRPLRIVECIGIAVVVRFLTMDLSVTRKEMSTLETIGQLFMGSLMSWGYGAIVHLFL